MRARTGRRAAVGILIALGLLVAATPAQAAFGTWTGLPGLNAGNGANWIREYTEDPTTLTLYAATEGDGVYRSVNGGLSWSDFSAGLDAQPGGRTVRTVYVGGGKVYAGTDAGLFSSSGGAWTPVAQGPEGDPSHPTKLNLSVQTVLSNPVGTLLAGTFSGGVYKSSDGGATWTPPAAGNGMPSGETVWSLASLAPNLIFAATSDGVFRSLDFGSTWTPANDGISGETLRIYADGTNPNIYYVGTAGDGVFRSINAGLTWSPINGAPGHELGDETVRALQQYNGVNLTRLYVGTGNGVYAGTTGNGPVPGAVTWRHIANTGLIDMSGTNTIFWALFKSITTPGLLVGGTQSNGGYVLQLAPPVNQTVPTVSGTLEVGKTMAGTNGTWSGTPDIEYTYQWQRCTSTSTASCSNIDNATASTYPLVPADMNDRVRLVVTASNDFPTFNKVTAASAISAAVAANPGTLPGANQSSTANISDLGPGDPSLPQSGDTLQATGWLFNPAATSTSFVWLRCDAGGSACDPIPGQTAQTYQLRDDDVTLRLRVIVRGTNASGTTTLGQSGATNTIFPQAATNLVAPAVLGAPYVGASVIGNVGVWKYPGTTYKHYWAVCEADGSDCETRTDQTGATYTPTADDLGHTLRYDVTADSNEDNHFPGPVEVLSPPSAAITNPPPPPGAGGPGGEDGGGAGGGGNASPPPPPPPPAVIPPSLGSPKLSTSKVKSGKTVKLSYRLSSAATLSVVLQRERAGRKKGKKCVAGRKKGKKCTVDTTVKTFTFKQKAGAGAVTIPTKIGKHKLPRGDYVLRITPIDAAKHKGATKTLKLKVS